ncbi:DUF1064 domain-containing protein [Paenalcaligenes sp. Me131]|uniref:DUF1064 domain-containing protein n=1 Tax=Paenalcaligenes sp. Me131 TaxID=3392636 RepID=UPI003D2C7415
MVAVITARGRKKISKYKNVKTVVDGHKFDSKKEARRYQALKLLLQAGQITDLELQKRYELIPTQRKSDGTAVRVVTYYADFVYMRDGVQVVEDVKGVRTDVFVLKSALMLQVHGIEVQEV